MKLVVGLGNPGPRYRGTRHNIGFAVVDDLSKRWAAPLGAGPADALESKARLASGPVILAKPLTFMNLSGHAVRALQQYYRVPVDALLVIVDDAALPLGRLRARGRGSAGGHNGLKSIIEQLGTSDFARLRIGVGRGDARRDLADHVLARFDADERPVIEEAISEAADAVSLFVADGIAAVMNRYNRKDTEPESAADN